MKRPPVEGEQPATAKASQSHFSCNTKKGPRLFVKSVHVLHRNRRAVQVLHVYVPHVKAAAQKLQVHLGLVSKKLGTPVPRLPGGGTFRKNHPSVAAVHLEIHAAVPKKARFPGALGQRNRGRRSLTRCGLGRRNGRSGGFPGSRRSRARLRALRIQTLHENVPEGHGITVPREADPSQRAVQPLRDLRKLGTVQFGEIDVEDTGPVEGHAQVLIA